MRVQDLGRALALSPRTVSNLLCGNCKSRRGRRQIENFFEEKLFEDSTTKRTPAVDGADPLGETINDKRPMKFAPNDERRPVPFPPRKAILMLLGLPKDCTKSEYEARWAEVVPPLLEEDSRREFADRHQLSDEDE